MSAANIGRLREPKHVLYITENQTEDVRISQDTCAYTLLKECGLMWPRVLPNVVLRRNSTGCMCNTRCVLYAVHTQARVKPISSAAVADRGWTEHGSGGI